MDAPARGGGRDRARELLRHLPRLSQPQGDRALPAARRPVRPRAGGRRPRHVPRPRPRGPAARPARDRRRGAPAVDLLRRVHRLPAALAGPRARVLAPAAAQPVLRGGAVDQLGPRRGDLLPAPGARPDLRLPAVVRRAAAHRGDATAADAPRRPDRLPRGPDERDAAGDRRVRVAARRDELHRAARGVPARPGPVAEDRALGLARADARSRRSTSAGTTSSTTSPAWRSA